MALGILMTGGFFGFISAVTGGLVLGLDGLECFGVYAAIALTTSTVLFTARGLWCAAAASADRMRLTQSA